MADNGRLDERALRRPDFSADGEPVTLCDGQDWTIPSPQIHFVLGADNGAELAFAWGPEYDALIRAADEVQERVNADARGAAGPDAPADPAETARRYRDYLELVAAQLRVAHFLLTRNYNLTREQFNTLFRIRYGDPDLDAMRHRVMLIGRGMTLGPKPSPGGGG
jgi:hypothetical protein